ncbi:Mic19p [Sporobolomyces salmoneus]|uniref:Mic19p n=1 Tax=Sporobolomyces salmoneus TaxID=183962 RepID=UPI00316BFCA4
MGSGASRPDQEINSNADQTFFANRDSPVQFSETLINHLSSQSTPSSSVPSSRQEALDAHIQARIQSELAQLRQQEQQVRQEIERALEKENLDREKGNAQEGGESSDKGLSHSASLFEDLKQLEKRTAGVKKQQQETPEWKKVEEGKKALEKCFSDNQKTPLECRAEAEKFKAAVAGVEKVFISSIN